MTPHTHPASHSGFVAALPRDAAPAQSSPDAGAIYSSAYRELLRQRAFWQATYSRHCLLRQSQAAEAARKRLWAATCALLDHERRARTVDL